MGECRLCGNVREATIHLDQLDADSAMATNKIRNDLKNFQRDNLLPVFQLPTRLADGTDV